LGEKDGWKIIKAIIDIEPNTFNISSKSGQNSVTAYVEIPGYDVNMIDTSTIYLSSTNGTVFAESKPISVSDYDNDGLPDIMVKFNKQSLINLVRPPSAMLTIEGKIGDKIFEGSDVIRIIQN